MSGHGDRHLSRGIHLAEEDLRHSLSAVHTRFPRVDDGRHVGGDPFVVERFPVDDDSHYRSARFHERPHQFRLPSVEVHRRTVRRFPVRSQSPVGADAVAADHDDRQVTRRCHAYGLAYAEVGDSPAFFQDFPLQGRIGGIGPFQYRFRLDLSAVAERDLRASRRPAHSLEHGHHTAVRLGERPVAQDGLVVRIGAGHEDPPVFRGVQRQEIPLVLEQDHAFAGRLERRPAVVGRDIPVCCRIRIAVFKQPQAELHLQDAPHGIVYAAHRDLSLPDQLPYGNGKLKAVGRIHVHVHSGIDAFLQRLRLVLGGEVQTCEVVHVHHVADEESPEAEFPLHHVGEQPARGMAGDTPDVIVSGHDGHAARFDGSLEGRKDV